MDLAGELQQKKFYTEAAAFRLLISRKWAWSPQFFNADSRENVKGKKKFSENFRDFQ